MSGRVVLVDHDQLFSAALAALLVEEGMTVEATVQTLAGALRMLEQIPSPDLIVVDPATLPDGTAADILTELRRAAPDAGLVALTADQTDGALLASLGAGVDGHIAKTASFDGLYRSLCLVILGQSIYPPRITALWDQGAPSTDDPASMRDLADLSPRERQILSCVVAGLSNKAIARRLAITESTVKMHFKNVMRKIDAGNRTQAAIWAMDHGIPPVA